MLCEVITIKARYLLKWTPTTQPRFLHNIPQTIYRITWDTIPIILDYYRVSLIKYLHITVITLIVNIIIVFPTDFPLITLTRNPIFRPGKTPAARARRWEEAEGREEFRTIPSLPRPINLRKTMYRGHIAPVVPITGVPLLTGFSLDLQTRFTIVPVPTPPWRTTIIRATWCYTRTWSRTKTPANNLLRFTPGWE